METHVKTDEKEASNTVQSFFLVWLFSVVSLFINFSTSAQNGVLIGPTAGTANASAMLEVSSTNKGLLLPRVSLVALANGTTPINAPAAGLMVYNLGSVGVPAVGIYYWDGAANAWVQLTSGGLSGSGTTNQLAKWTSPSAIGNSLVFDNGTNVAIGTTTPVAKLDVRGAATITTGSNYANANSNMASGSLTIGGTDVNFGGGSSWNATTAGLLLECADNTEIGVHDGSTRIASTMYYQGDAVNRITVGRDMGWGKTNFAVATLTGTGDRPVYADANGILKTLGVPVVYSYTGVNQTYTVPAGVTSLTIKLWGAGGGGGYYGGWTYGYSGGAGGFTKATLAVTPGQSLTIIVGEGGHGGNVSSTADSYGGGGRSCATASDCRYGGQGGGRSAIRNGATELLTAGGGGGGGASRCLGCHQYGGAGGGYIGQNGTSGQYWYGAGQGGQPSAGGAGASNMTNNGTAGVQFLGGRATQNSYGGGGGGGYYGGGGGGYAESNTMGAGGGGSGYIGGAGVSNGRMEAGDTANPGGSLDDYYVPGIAVGGITNQTAVPLYGGNGMVVIIPN